MSRAAELSLSLSDACQQTCRVSRCSLCRHPSVKLNLHYLLGYKMKLREGGQSAVKLAGGDVASPFARDAGWSAGHVLLVAARAEDERDVGFNSTYCV